MPLPCTQICGSLFRAQSNKYADWWTNPNCWQNITWHSHIHWTLWLPHTIYLAVTRTPTEKQTPRNGRYQNVWNSQSHSSNLPTQNLIQTHFRHRDDGFKILGCNDNNIIQDFFKSAYSQHDLMKFTFELSTNEATFSALRRPFIVNWALNTVLKKATCLDTMLFKGNRFHQSQIFDIKTHTKETDTFQYLHTFSCHQESAFRGFILGQTLRNIHTNSDPSTPPGAI